MAIIKRFSTVRQGGTVFAGNTLGLAPATTSGGGYLGSIAVFTSLDTSLQVTGYPKGTTLDYRLNGSAATLSLPAGAYVLYAELIWGGLYKYGSVDISSLTDNEIVFGTPAASLNVSGDAATRNNLLLPAGMSTLGFYVRSKDVTAAVRAAGSGVYSVKKVPALIANPSSFSSDTNHAGWTLAVVYEDSAAPLRSLTLWCGGTAVSLSAGSTDITVSGFLTPETLPVSGKIFVSAQEGDAVIDGDRLQFGRTAASLSSLSGPNNPVNNFFASQINNSSGLLDTSGTFGTRNAVAATGQNTSACRQGWDITAVDLTPLLQTGQTSALIRLTTSGDLYVTNALAIQIDSKGANLQLAKSADRSFVAYGNEIGYTLTVRNTGTTDAVNVSVSDPMAAGMTLKAGSIKVDGVSYAGGFPVQIASVAAGATATVTYTAVASSLPSVNPTVNSATANYEFSPFVGITVSASAKSNDVPVYIVYNKVLVIKSVDKNYATDGDELTYSFTVANTGNLAAEDVVFTDVAPNGTSFVENSLTVDGVPLTGVNPADGVNLGTLAVGSVRTLTFRVKINQD